ncbi:MAG: hypothetical protein JSW58_05040 [Candidatus Latescibacterota bacterium]|nr:MAG: hypothetical protein JSW58_05040 [Candidatus Latescibacterota bacterium]
MYIYIILAILGFVAIVILIDRINQSKIERLRRAGVYPLPGQESDRDVERLIRLGRKIEAIKVYRTIHHVDLRTARQAVEALERQITDANKAH